LSTKSHAKSQPPRNAPGIAAVLEIPPSDPANIPIPQNAQPPAALRRFATKPMPVAPVKD